VIDFMYICICNAITDSQIRQAAEAGVTDLRGLQQELGVAAGCGSCKEAAAALLSETGQRTRTALPRIYRPALA
jgi:bacterioferritin-associated ferredoxin